MEIEEFVVNIELILLFINKYFIRLLVKGHNPSLCLLKPYKGELIVILNHHLSYYSYLSFNMKVEFDS